MVNEKLIQWMMDKITGYRWIHLMRVAVEGQGCDWAIKRIEDAVTEDRVCPGEREEVSVALDYLRIWIAHELNELKLWSELRKENIESGTPVISHTHDISLSNYIWGLHHRNMMMEKHMKWEEISPYIQEKTVIDLGCGSCFFAQQFSFFNPDIIIAVDREEIIDLVREEIPEGKPFSSNIRLVPADIFSFLSSSPRSSSTFFLSEVLHGMSDEQVVRLSYLMWKKSGDINLHFAIPSFLIVNELDYYSARPRLFDVQMRVNTKGGDVRSSQALATLLSGFWDPITSFSFSPIHMMSIYKRESV